MIPQDRRFVKIQREKYFKNLHKNILKTPERQRRLPEDPTEGPGRTDRSLPGRPAPVPLISAPQPEKTDVFRKKPKAFLKKPKAFFSFFQKNAEKRIKTGGRPRRGGSFSTGIPPYKTRFPPPSTVLPQTFQQPARVRRQGRGAIRGARGCRLQRFSPWAAAFFPCAAAFFPRTPSLFPRGLYRFFLRAPPLFSRGT